MACYLWQNEEDGPGILEPKQEGCYAEEGYDTIGVVLTPELK